MIIMSRHSCLIRARRSNTNLATESGVSRKPLYLTGGGGRAPSSPPDLKESLSPALTPAGLKPWPASESPAGLAKCCWAPGFLNQKV